MESSSESRASSRASDTKHVPLLGEDVARAWKDSQRPERPPELNNALFSVVQLTNSMIGSGILSFPYVFSKTGVVLALVLLATFGGFVYATSLMVLEVGKEVDMPVGDLSEIVEAALGLRWRRGLDLCAALMCFGALMSYFNVIGLLGADLFAPTRPPFLGINNYPSFMTLCAVFLSPACFLRSYGELTPVSIISIGCITVTTFAIAITGVVHGRHAIPLWPDSALAPFALLGNYAYAMTVQFVVHEMYASMVSTDRPAVRNVVLSSILVGATLLGIMGLGGVAAVGSSPVSNIIQSLDETNPLTKVLSVFTIFHLMMYIPNDFVIMRLFALRFFDINPLQIPTVKYIAITAVLFATPLLIMASIPRALVVGVFELVIALTGQIPTATCCFLIPTLAFKATCLRRASSSSTPNRSFLYNPALSNLFLAACVVVILISPIVTIYVFVHTCLTSACKDYA
ncbi:hypothetical protein CTAYLR_002256 [Chrysophaeum taylorii]|uniref:Amino acid transporter transmembrane domain-containing protein n=1 Tax=Chrysophaeum taylorii TaxID=2483200 RepID=A0AAD7UPP7_9STRA|nr:hypothetical protein CTAYLR_002256 [Chrysophaeum taylorii]